MVRLLKIMSQFLHPLCSLSILMGGLCGFNKYNIISNRIDSKLENKYIYSYLFTTSILLTVTTMFKQPQTIVPKVGNIFNYFVTANIANGFFFCTGHHIGLATDKVYLRFLDDMRLIKYNMPSTQNQQLDAVKASDNIL